MAEEVAYKVVFNKSTGALQEVKAELGKVDQAAKGAGQSGSEAFQKMGGKVREFATGLVVGQLALEGLRRVAQESSAFQELQATFEKTARTASKELEPAFSLISRGLQGVVILVGGAVPLIRTALDTLFTFISKASETLVTTLSGVMLAFTGDFKGAWEQVKTATKEGIGAVKGLADGDWASAWQKMVQSSQDAFARMTGTTQQRTKMQVEALNERTTAELAHIDAMAQVREEAANREFNDIFTHDERKKAIIAASAEAAIADLDAKEALQEDLLKSKREQGMVGELVFQEQMLALKQGYHDRRVQVASKAATQEAQVEQRKTELLKNALQTQMTAFASAAARRYQETKDLGQALRAAAAEEIRQLGQQAATTITIKGAEAAAKSFANAGGYPAGIATAAATFVFYAGLAAVVLGASGAAASAVEGSPSAGGGGGGGAGDYGATGAATGQGMNSNGTPAVSQYGGSIGGNTGPGGGVGPTYNISVSAADALDAQKTARIIAEEIDRLRRS